MYVVFGANGRAGGAVVRALIDRNEKVRAVIRRPEQAERWAGTDVNVFVADLANADQASAALQGATAAFVLNPPPAAGDVHHRTVEIASAMFQAVRQARTPKLVVLSSIGAQHADGNGVIDTLNRFEALLNDASPAVAMLRSGYFIESWSEVTEDVRLRHVLPSFVDPRHKIAMVSATDVGRAAAQLMTERWTGTRVVELLGPCDYCPAEVAKAFADVLGHDVATAFIPPDERAAILEEQGLPSEVSAALLKMYEGIAAGRFTPEVGAEKRRGTSSLHEAIAALVSGRRDEVLT